MRLDVRLLKTPKAAKKARVLASAVAVFAGMHTPEHPNQETQAALA